MTDAQDYATGALAEKSSRSPPHAGSSSSPPKVGVEPYSVEALQQLITVIGLPMFTLMFLAGISFVVALRKERL